MKIVRIKRDDRPLPLRPVGAHGMFARRLPVFLTILALSSGIAGCADGIDFRTDDPAEAAGLLRVSIPEGASEVHSYTSPTSQGSCTDLSFLMPTENWRPYTATYFQEDLPESFARNLVCNTLRPPCPELHSAQKFEAADSILVNKSNQDRTILVISECEPGQTLIAWKTSAT